MITTINATLPNQNIRYWDWENRQDEAKMPEQTLLGVDGFTWAEDRGRWTTRYGLGLSSYRDANLLQEIEILDLIQQTTGEGKKIKLLDPVTGVSQTEMVVSAWQLSPMAQSELRNYRTISIELLRTASTTGGSGR